MKCKLFLKESLLALVVAAVFLTDFAVISTVALGDSNTPTYGGGDTHHNTTRVTSNQTPNLAGVVHNGNFETGDFTGWNTVDRGSGQWLVYKGGTVPISGITVPAPPEGVFAASTDQGGPGTHILFQDITLGPQPQPLSFILYYQNRAGRFVNPPSLDFTGAENQQYRVDIMNPAAPVDSVAPGDVLANLFQTTLVSPPIMTPTLMTFDLSAFAGQTVRLRFAEVDNLFFFEAAVDDVRLGSVPVGGSVTGTRPSKVICLNVTTGKLVVIRNKTTAWDCEAAGLVVHPGDTILQTSLGKAD